MNLRVHKYFAGFLNANDKPNQRSIANYGLMDILAGLHWLKENVEDFGGDAENVTLFGHHTGAASINFLMTSKAIPKGTARIVTHSSTFMFPSL